MKRYLVIFAAFGLAVALASPALASGPPDVFEFDDAFDAVNPCTDETHTVFVHVTVVVHEFEIEVAERHHVNVKVFFDVETDDGFSGSAVSTDIDNGSGLFGGEEGTGMAQGVINVNLSNDAGQRLKVHELFHFNQVGGELVAFVEHGAETCRGTPG